MKNRFYILLLLIGLMMPFVSLAQRVTIRGVVRAAIDREALPRVSVRLLTAKDST